MDDVQRLTGLDSAFVALETDTSCMHISGVVTLEPGADGRPARYEDIRAHLAPRLRETAVLRRRLREVPLGLDHPVWIDEDFDLDAHVHHIAAPRPGSSKELAGVVGHLAGLRLDRARPLWDLWIIEGLEEGRTALMLKIHHALIDGVLGAEVFARLFDDAPDAPRRKCRDAGTPPREAPSASRLLRAAGRSLLAKPFELARQSLGSLAAAVRGIRAVAAEPRAPILPLPALSAPPTRLNGAITSRREVVFCSARLADLQRAKRALGVTLNDLVLAGCAGGLRGYLSQSGDTPETPLVAAVPVSVATRDAAAGNAVSAMTVDLPVQLADPISRLASIHLSAVRAKRAHRAIGGEVLAGWAEVAPPALLSWASDFYSRLSLADRHRPLVNLIASNVPGPQKALYCAGHRVEACHPLGPIFEGCALNVTVFSYDGGLHAGLIACPDVIPDLPRLADAIRSSLDELRTIAESRARPGRRPVATGRRPDAIGGGRRSRARPLGARGRPR